MGDPLNYVTLTELGRLEIPEGTAIPIRIDPRVTAREAQETLSRCGLALWADGTGGYVVRRGSNGQ